MASFDTTSCDSLAVKPLMPTRMQRILIIDDDEDDFLLIKDYIQAIPGQNFVIEWCSNYVSGSAALHRATHDIYFIDYFLGPRTGMDLLREAMEQDYRQPVVMLTGQGNHEIDLQAMRMGAVDYLTKSQLTSEQLDRCIRYALERASVLRESRSNELKFRAIFERSKDVIFISNSNLDILHINQAATDLTGYSLDELLHMNLADLIIGANGSKDLETRLQSQMELIDLEIDVLTKTRAARNCLLSCSWEIDHLGNPYMQGMVHDISILKKSEEIRSQSEKLEARGLTIRTLAHEIRNPLHNIMLSSGLLKSDTNSENEELLKVIDRNSKRINDLLNELMDSNQFHKMKLEVLPLQQIIDETLKEAQDLIHLKGVKIKYTPPLAEAYALLDRDKVRSALLNLVVNAIEAMEKQTGELTIRIDSLPEFYKIEITDNGCGMSAEDSAKIFEPYFTTKQKGMGLGLVAAYSILQSHKAEIHVSSALGKGTTFSILFPALRAGTQGPRSLATSQPTGHSLVLENGRKE